jgi:exportin-5
MHFDDDEFLSLVCPMYTSQMVELLRKLFEWSVVDPHGIDDEKYLFAKKFSEVGYQDPYTLHPLTRIR